MPLTQEQDRAMRKQRHAAPDARACPVEVALDVMGGKGKAVILWRIAGGAHRFDALRRVLCRITPRPLTAQLREMEADRLVTRHVFAEVPPRVGHALTDRAQALIPILDARRGWSGEHVYDAGPAA